MIEPVRGRRVGRNSHSVSVLRYWQSVDRELTPWLTPGRSRLFGWRDLCDPTRRRMLRAPSVLCVFLFVFYVTVYNLY